MEESVCANCSVPVSASSFVALYKMPESVLSVYQALALVFHYKEESMTDAKLCCDCGKLFGKLLHYFADFARQTDPGSYVHRIINLNASSQMHENPFIAAGHFLKQEITDGMFQQNFYSNSDSIPEYGELTDSILDTTSDEKIRNHHIIELRQTLGSKVLEAEASTHRIKGKNLQGPNCKQKRHYGKLKSQDVVAVKESFSVVQTVAPKRIRNIFNCKTCGMEFFTKSAIKMHNSRHTGTRPFDCEICNTNYKSKSILASHMRQCHKEIAEVHWRPKPRRKYTEEELALLITAQYICDVCTGVSVSTFKDWVIHHKEIHKLDMGYADVYSKKTLEPINGFYRPCPRCGKKLKRNCEMIPHIKCEHLNSREFYCEICDKNYSSKQLLQSHQQFIHEKREPQFLCTLCGFTSATKQSLEAHEKKHLNLFEELTHECDICFSKFPSSRRLKEHQICVHSSERPFACNECDSSFKLSRHLTKHKKDRHYKKYIIDQFCEFCGKGYAFKITLKEHLMSAHKLSKEDARISAKMRTSTIFRIMPNGERVFKTRPTKPKTCEICDKTYVRREQLFTHLISVHGKTPEEAKEITGLESKRNLVPGSVKSSTNPSLSTVAAIPNTSSTFTCL